MASRLVGAMDPLPGIEPNFTDPPSLRQSNLIQHATCLSIIFLLICMRIYTRVRVLRVNLGVDDYLCLLSYLLDCAYSGLIIKACSKGLGRHMWDVEAANVPEALKYLMLSAWVYLIATGTIKLTFLFTYRGIFSIQSKVKTFVNIGIVFVTCLTLSLFFSSVFSCNPIPKAWNTLLPGTCSDPSTLAWVSAISSSVTDLYIWTLPIIPLWRLNLTLEKRLKVMVAFSFGLIACAASLVRLGMTQILQESPDALYTTAAIGRWSAIEIDVGIMCSCLMLLPAFINHHTPERWREYLSHRICQLSGSVSETKHYAECSWPKGRFRELDGERDLAKSRTEESIHSLQPSVELADKGKLLSQSRAY